MATTLVNRIGKEAEITKKVTKIVKQYRQPINDLNQTDL
jgi:hypothetical protein